MKLNEIVDWDRINKKRELMKAVHKQFPSKPESPEAKEARKEHARKAIANNFKKGFIDKATHDRQLADVEKY